jgi:hypothetical protein
MVNNNSTPEPTEKTIAQPVERVNKTKKIGRPKKSKVLAKTKGNRKRVGRPKGDASVIAEYKARLLASPKSKKVLNVILDAALDDEHKNQAAAWKMLIDRLLPLSHFDKDTGGSGKASVNITITGVDGVKTVIGEETEEPIEADFSVIDEAS